MCTKYNETNEQFLIVTGANSDNFVGEYETCRLFALILMFFIVTVEIVNIKIDYELHWMTVLPVLPMSEML